ncbi:MAG: response regulator transcription factor [Anaerolineales bacterium]|nr:response regulator transcription factor [Anaerolineales bacterium]
MPFSQRVVIADDNALVLEGLSAFLERDGMSVIGQAHDGLEAVEITRELDPDILLLDINMPRWNGFQALQALKSGGSRARVIMLTAHDDPQLVNQALELGADGFVSKDDGPFGLRGAIKTAMGGQFLFIGKSAFTTAFKKANSSEEM